MRDADFEQSELVKAHQRLCLIFEVARQLEKQMSPDTKLKSGQYSYWINGIKITKHL